MISKAQKQIFVGMVAGVSITTIVFLSPLYWPQVFPNLTPNGSRLALWLALNSTIAICLVIAVARLARHRFFSAEDIDAGAGGTPTRTARVLQSILQNTLEQTVVAVIAYGGWLFLAPKAWHIIAVLCAGLFIIGRAVFFIGYTSGASSRSFGFALTFYPSAALIIGLAVLQIGRLF